MLFMLQERDTDGRQEGNSSALWRSRKSNRFEHRYKKLSDEVAQKVDEVIVTLLSSDRPERKGIEKTASRKGYFAWELGQSCRVLYRPIYEEKVIEFFRVCSHNEAYLP
jgi:mRNA-degrading endonuclease RelE of RelBE toxin-antitoxin system